MQSSDTSHTTNTTPQVLQGFEDFVRARMQDWRVQGLAVAIVKDGAVIFSQGFGKRDGAQNLEVTPQTLFPIASCTKAFTTATLAILADEGKLDWDTPLRTYLPTFKLYDTVASERLTPRDIVTHRSGLPRHDLAWYHSSATRQELFERLQYLEPTKDIRTLWQYQNLMYMVAGYLVGQISGQSWEEFVQTRIFNPLGMTRSNFSIVETEQHATDYSHPYREIQEKVEEIPFYGAQGAIGPAGAIVSCIDEMSKWVLLHSNNGKFGDKQVISENQIAQLHAPQMIIPESSRYTEMPYSSYALGWFVTPYRGQPMLHHGGNIDGFSSLTSLLPQQNLGIVVLSNMGGTPIPSILTYNIFDRFLSLDAVAWSERFKKDEAEFKAAEQKGKEKTETDRVPDTHPSHALDAYTGDFANSGYGTLSVVLKDGELQATFNGIACPLKHYHYDIFELDIERWQVNMKASFATNVRGDIESITAPFEPTAKDIVFKRVPQKSMSERSFLESFVGKYEVMSMIVTVDLKDDSTLQLTVPGQPTYVLTPYRGTEFQIQGLSGFSVEFKQDESGSVVEAILTQLNTTFTAKKLTTE